jgi:hypothetical protein
MTTATLGALHTDVPAAVDLDVAGSIEEELGEQRIGELVAGLSTLPSISTLACVTSKHDTVLMPRL